MLSDTQSCFLSYFPLIIYCIIPTTQGIVKQEYFKAAVSQVSEGMLCSVEVADDIFSVPRLSNCVIACTQNPLCMEFNFRVDAKTCELYYCRASHLLQTTAGCVNYQSQKLRSGIYGIGCESQLMLPEKCSFPFTLNGIRYYDCTSNPSSTTHEYGCYDDSHMWRNCGLPRDYIVSEMSTDLTIPSSTGVTTATVMSVNNWIIFHRRVYDTLQYNRPWSDYKAGFGAWSSDYWLGIEKIYQMTTEGTWRLRIEMEALGSGEWVSVEYDTFRLDSEALFYALHVSPLSFGDAPDLLWVHNGMAFTTYDADHDNWPEGVCGSYSGNNGFWFNNCFTVCLTCTTTSVNHYGFTMTSGTTTLARSNMMMKRM